MKTVRVKRRCKRCSRESYGTCRASSPEEEKRARASLTNAAWQCPWCDRRHNIATDLFGGRGVRPCATHRVNCVPVGTREPEPFRRRVAEPEPTASTVCPQCGSGGTLTSVGTLSCNGACGSVHEQHARWSA